MDMIADDYLRQLQALLPQGSAWPRDQDAVLTKLLGALAEELSRVGRRGEELLDEADPRSTSDLLADWERVAGLPDGCARTVQALAPGKHVVSVADITSFSRASTATYVDGGLLKHAGVDRLRTESNLLLIEESRTNLLKYSEQFDNAVWFAKDISVTPNTSAGPDGAMTADMLTVTATGDTYIRQVASTSETVTHSVYVKQGGTDPSARVVIRLITNATALEDEQILFDFETRQFSGKTNSVANYGYEVLANGWYRIWVTNNAAPGQEHVELRLRPDDNSIAVVGKTVLVFGAQVEAGGAVSSYIPTTATSATRAADVALAYKQLSAAARRAAVVSKLTSLGGQSRQYFIDMAASLGYPGATITEFRPLNCNDDCNDAMNDESERFTWRINLPNSNSGAFIMHCNSTCNDALGAWGDEVLECRVNHFKPAHTTVLFAYL